MSLLSDYAASLSQPTLPLTSAGGSVALRYDEVVGADGSLRPAWKGMAAISADLTPAELRRIDGEITTLLADDGVTYAHPGGRSRPWLLDPVPLVLDAPTWARLEIGLAQRAELLNALLADLYGPQELLARGVVPAAVIFGHAGFARGVARPSAFDPHPLVLSGADLGRDAGGEWHVLADRVQAPSGLGYAMENRRVIARVLSELYQEAGPHRIEPYVAVLRSALLRSAPPGVADPRAVVLSPGTHSETAYDQAFLANILGFPLVQGNDLVVRDGWVWMKPAGWPRKPPVERVDVIVRRVDADWCDPLELRADSQLGVTGLVEVARRGRVRVVNGLGAGVLENPALLAYMPAICEQLLGEQLRLPSVSTWWCGEPAGRDTVLSRLSGDPRSLIVRTIDQPAAAFAKLTPSELRERILAAPHRFVGQERLPLSQAPAWGSVGSVDGQVDPRPLMLRTFTIRDRTAYRPLVGGMATIVDDDDRAPTTKDVWVLKESPTDADQGLDAVDAATIARSIPVLAPRALEDMLWAGRYAERAEDLLRLIIATHSFVEQPDASPDGAAAQLVLRRALARLCGTRWLDPDDELRSLLLDADRPGSAADSLDRLRDSLEGVRDQLSGDTWRAFGITDRATAALRSSPHAHQVSESAGRMLTGILSLQGVTASMIRDAGWHMIEAGRQLERALQICTLLTATTTTPLPIEVEAEVLGGVLAAGESSVTHRRRYRGSAHTIGVLELLLTDPHNPRSLVFSLAQLRSHLVELPASTGSTRPERLLEQLQDTLERADVAALAVPVAGGRPALETFLGETSAHLNQLADAITQLHFESGPLPQPIFSLSLTEAAEVST